MVYATLLEEHTHLCSPRTMYRLLRALHEVRERRHSGIAYLTPTIVHHGAAPAVLVQRDLTLHAAYHHHPERFVRGAPKPSTLPLAVCINRVDTHTEVVAS